MSCSDFAVIDKAVHRESSVADQDNNVKDPSFVGERLEGFPKLGWLEVGGNLLYPIRFQRHGSNA